MVCNRCVLNYSNIDIQEIPDSFLFNYQFQVVDGGNYTPFPLKRKPEKRIDYQDRMLFPGSILSAYKSQLNLKTISEKTRII